PQTAAELLPSELRSKIATGPDPDLMIQLAEVTAALGHREETLRLMASAVSLGWRDLRWLEHSPQLAHLLRTPAGGALVERVRRELVAQQHLIDRTPEIQRLLTL
ncbi:MAG: hypothetical protein AAFX94_25515, partial [Myxococcota bacterium]